MRRLVPWLLAALLFVAAWPPFGPGLLLIAAFALLAAALEGLAPRRAFGATWLWLTLSAAAVYPWFPDALTDEYGVAGPAAVAFMLAIIAFLALATALAAAIYARLSPTLSDLSAPLVFGALWVGSEWLRLAGLGSPWLIVAHTLSREPFWLQTAELGGAWLPSFVLAASGAGLGLAAARRSVPPLAAPGLLLAFAAGFGALRSGHAPETSGEAFRVVVIQASVPQAQRFQPGSALRNTREHAALTRAAAAAVSPELVVWSETAVDDDLDGSPALMELLVGLTREIGVPLVTGAPRSASGRPENVVVLFTPEGGLAESYAKQRLVPIAEGDPFWMRPLQALVPEVAEGDPYAEGSEPTVFRRAAAPFSTPICFEVTYPDLMREFRAAGAEWIVNLSNDAWFGASAYPEMHLAHAVLRAVELRTWIVRGANTGISAAIDPGGRIVGEVPIFEDGSVVARVEPNRERTLYARLGDVPVGVLLVGIVLWGRTTRRGG